MEFLEGCNKLKGSDYSVYDIIDEETQKFINGESTAEQCADMIQNRVTIYLSEQG